MPYDQIQLNFSPSGLMALNIMLGFIMFGVALDMKIFEFTHVFKKPKPVLIGLFGQFILLPAITFLLILIINPSTSVALGMILVASCPGGNLSNFLTHLAKGNTALSVSMSAISTLSSIVMTPLNFAIWASLLPKKDSLLKDIVMPYGDIFIAIFLLLGLPLALGLLVSYQFPKFAAKASKIFRLVSIVFFLAFVIAALSVNWSHFINYVGFVMIAVFLQNALALAIGYYSSKFLKLEERDRRAVSIEIGIQNSGLGLILIFNFFSGLGGMALVAAWWGIWHIISGLTIAFYWSRKTNK
ncbi:bile acid:sodium symporter family protein [Leptospira sp. GIMC2001]|uniref:bile acid:sodium symporter family protein n=1 Tax=Leptospira sp. GIMC2001 TaxID=1513297 RepID=UPI002349B74D|nr:bile acid:sodium symporter family protein [Leptospira sp. GIMC2001]WCL50595.1 bile acid:sodium symporter family protein [Leptospira sp. GIMC2001]